MAYYLTKVLISALIVVLVSEVSKRSTFVGSFLASLPLVSFLAMIWLYAETKDAQKVADLSTGIFWLVLPSLALFLTLPWLIRHKVDFYTSLAASTVVMIGCYFLAAIFLRKVGIKI